MMTVNPHPFVLTKVAEQRRADIHAWAEHYRLGELAQQGTARRLHWADLAAVVTVVLALTFSAAWL